MKRIWNAIYRLVLALWVGGVAIFTFLVTPIIFRSFSRDQAGEVVGHIFPVYFPYLLALAAVALVAFLLGKDERSSVAAGLPVLLLVGALAVDAYVTFKLHPDIVEVKRGVASFEREPPESQARKRFGKLHALSAALNLLILVDGVVLLLIGPAIRNRSTL